MTADVHDLERQAAEPAPGRVWQVPSDLLVPGHDDADTLVLAPVDRPTFDALVHAHLSASVVTEVGALVDTDALDAALLAECTVAPKLTVEQARELLDDWPPGECDDLMGCVFELCPDQGALDRAWWRLERDPSLRVEMSLCANLGIPRSQYLGGGTVWTQTDRDLAMAHELRRIATCGGCGTRRDQWLDDDGHLDRQAMDVDWEECPGCYLLSRARKAAGEKGGDVLEYTHPHLVPVTDDDDEDGDD